MRAQGRFRPGPQWDLGQIQPSRRGDMIVASRGSSSPSQAVGQPVEGLKTSMSDGSTISINGRPVRLLHVSDNRARLELGWRVSPSTTIHLKVEPPGGEPIVMKSRVVSARVATVKDGTITYSAEVTFGRCAIDVAGGANVICGEESPLPPQRHLSNRSPTQWLPLRRLPRSRLQRTRIGRSHRLDARVGRGAAARRAELAEERERRQKGEETAQESEGRSVNSSRKHEAQKRRWEDERTTLSTEL